MERLPQGVRRLAVQLRLVIDPQRLWDVLTDYENLAHFIPNLASSRVVWRREQTVCLEQVGSQQFCGLRFSARVQLELTDDATERDQLKTERDDDEKAPCVLAGPTCDSVDVLYEKDPYWLPVSLEIGDEVLIEGTGAYTTTYSAVAFNGFEPLKSYVI